MLSIPITIGLSITSNRPLQLSVYINLCSLFLELIYMTITNQQYDKVIGTCKDIFIKKAKDYGTAWRVLRTISIVDQIFIKAQRIRTIQEKGQQKVADDIANEFKG